MFTSIKKTMSKIGSYSDLITTHSSVHEEELSSLHVTGSVQLEDTDLQINSDFTSGTPTESCSISVVRGSQTNARLLWDESTDTWKAGLSGAEKKIALEGTDSNVTFNSVQTSGLLMIGNTLASHTGTLTLGSVSNNVIITPSVTCDDITGETIAVTNNTGPAVLTLNQVGTDVYQLQTGTITQGAVTVYNNFSIKNNTQDKIDLSIAQGNLAIGGSVPFYPLDLAYKTTDAKKISLDHGLTGDNFVGIGNSSTSLDLFANNDTEIPNLSVDSSSTVTSGNYIPLTTDVYDIGSSSKKMKDVYVSNSVKCSSLTDGRIIFQNGGGLLDDSSLTYNSSGTILAIDNLEFDGNTISSSNTNGDIILEPNGTGSVLINNDLVITNTGTGDCLRVNDEETDSTYFSIDANGKVGINRTSGGAMLDMRAYTADGTSEDIAIFRRNGNQKLFDFSKGSNNAAFMDIYDDNEAIAIRLHTTSSSYMTQSLQIGEGSSAQSNAVLECTSTTKGVLFPRMTTAQKNAISASAGLAVYDTDTNKLSVYNGTSWNDCF